MTIEARALDFGYPGHVVGRGLDLVLEMGEVLCVLGPNGSGKTTLLRTLLGLQPRLGGQVAIAGEDIARMPRAKVAREVAYVPQASSSYFDFSLEEMVLMGRTSHLGTFDAPGKRDREVAHAALERMGIGALANRPVGGVSGGERQLALIARALATEARALVMDEPTANLDFGNQARVLAQIAALRDAGVSILLCSHDPDHAFQVADRVLLLRDGAASTLARTGEALTAENLTRLYDIPVQVAEVVTPAGIRRVCVRS
ncbi:MAG: ABC transporter ATP-binding protein [Burkholderiales bacterium]|nr:ABC transporter ATP-binding protein [Burkholderiales bacterium]